MTTCTGCLHERAGRCALLPKQYAGFPPIPPIPPGHYFTMPDVGPLWQWPPADERCGHYTTAETQAAQAKALAEAMVAAMRAAAGGGG